ncbi:rhodanese-like domain-containing protein [Bacteroidia bacterium]|jgi:hypothetical protein|nr:rhodanese-like domain-containing protein [Bacteroidia bacterium]
MKTVKLIIIAILIALVNRSISQTKYESIKMEEQYEKALVNYQTFKQLVNEVDTHRAKRLVSLNTFLAMSRDSNTLILDTRSLYRYNRKHIKGAIHLNFSDFTQAALNKRIPLNDKTRILIYCNNNFKNDQIDFTSKVAYPTRIREFDLTGISQPRTLALNIPTYLNLYGYGYRNIYELDELVSTYDKRLRLEGSAVKTRNQKD